MSLYYWLQKITGWGHKVGILISGTPLKQVEKMKEEALELYSAVIRHQKTLKEDGHASIEEIELEMGDLLVTMTLLCFMMRTDLTTCAEKAYNKINKRVDTGKLIDGVFVKEEDLK